MKAGFCFLLAAIWLPPAAATASTDGFGRFCVEEKTARTGTLANGFRYVIVPSRTAPGKVRIILDVLAGQQHEAPDQVDAAHLIEHLLLLYYTAPDGRRLAQLQHYNKDGPYTRNPTPYDIDIGGSPFDVYTPYGGTTDVRDMPLMIARLRQIAQGAAIQSNEFELHRRIILSERRSSVVDPRIAELARGWAGGKPQDISMKATRRGIQKLTFNAIMGYYNKWYRPDREILYVIGDVSPDSVERAVSETFGTLLPAQSSTKTYDTPSDSVRALVVQSKQSNVNHLELLFEDIAATDQRNLWKIGILREVIKERLNRAQARGVVPVRRVDVQIADASSRARQRSGFYHPMFWPDSFGIQLSFKALPKNFGAAVRYIWREIQDLAMNGLTDDELRAAKDKQLKDYWFGPGLNELEHDLRIGSRFCGLGTKRFEALRPSQAELDSFDSQSVQALLSRVAQPENIRFALLKAKSSTGGNNIKRFQDLLNLPDSLGLPVRKSIVPKLARRAVDHRAQSVSIETLAQPNGATLVKLIGSPKIYLVEQAGKPLRIHLSSGLRRITPQDLCRIPIIERIMRLESDRRKTQGKADPLSVTARVSPWRPTLVMTAPSAQTRAALLAFLEAVSRPDFGSESYSQAKIDHENEEQTLTYPLRAGHLWRSFALAERGLPSEINLSNCRMPTIEEIASTWRRLFSPMNDVVMVISGMFNKSEVLAALSEKWPDPIFSRIPAGSINTNARRSSVHIFSQPSSEHEVSVTLIAEGFERTRENMANLKAMIPIFGDRLSVRLRDIEGLVYFVDSEADIGLDGRALLNARVWAGKSEAGAVQQLVERELALLIQGGLTKREFELFKDAWLKEMRTPIDVARNLEDGFAAESASISVVAPDEGKVSQILRRLAEPASTVLSISPIREY